MLYDSIIIIYKMTYIPTLKRVCDPIKKIFIKIFLIKKKCFNLYYIWILEFMPLVLPIIYCYNSF